jgi:ribonuclease R
MLLRSMQQAIYSPYNVGHFGLSYESYAHFTSPIRRYPDLVIHRVIKALLRGERYQPPTPQPDDARSPVTIRPRRGGGPPTERDLAKAAGKTAARNRMTAEQREELDHWEQLGLQCSANERRADEASRDVEAWLKCVYMKERVGEQFRGTITGVAPFGIFVTLNELFVEGMVHVSELGSDYFQYIDAAHELRGERTGRRFRLTDELDVQVARVDLEARRIEFRMVKSEAPRPDAVRAAARVPVADELGPQDAGGPAEPAKRGKKAAPPKTPEVARKRAERLASKRRSGTVRSDPRGGKRKRHH